MCCKILCFLLFNEKMPKMLHVSIQVVTVISYFFIGQKINSMKRLLALNEELIKELIPQIGLRAGFLSSWKRLVVCVSAVQGEVLSATQLSI